MMGQFETVPVAEVVVVHQNGKVETIPQYSQEDAMAYIALLDMEHVQVATVVFENAQWELLILAEFGSDSSIIH